MFPKTSIVVLLAAGSAGVTASPHTTNWTIDIYTNSNANNGPGQGPHHQFSDHLTGACSPCDNFPKDLQGHLHSMALNVAAGNPAQVHLYKDLDCHKASYINEYYMHRGKTYASNLKKPFTDAKSLQVCARMDV